MLGYVDNVNWGEDVCDWYEVEVYEIGWSLRFIANYMHAQPYSADWYFSIPTRDPEIWYDNDVGQTIDDEGCDTIAQHVHIWMDDYNGINSSTNYLVPSGDYCLWDNNPSDCYGPDDLDYWTHWFGWDGF
jgi:hypothetical protein